MNLIEAAVAPLKIDAIARAEQIATAAVERVRKELEEAGFDLNVCAPYPSYRMHLSQWEQIKAETKYRQFRSLCQWRKNQSVRPGGPCYADVTPELAERYIENAKQNAAEQYDAFVKKLIFKIGDVTEATLEGNHVWSESYLTVVTVGGERQMWKTQMIVNTSKLGKLFNQFPTRKVKRKG
jgi:hypothetical protein